MSDYLILPPAGAFSGTVRVPSSKSATNRALTAAALTSDPVDVVGPLASDDTAALRSGLAAMGALIVETPDGLSVRGPLAGDPGAPRRLDVADSGTAARFLTAVCAAVPGRWTLTGSARLRERPIGELVDALSAGGARIEYSGAQGCLPLTIEGGSLRSGSLEVDASRSSQFVSALLLAGVAVEGGLVVRAAGRVASAPYVGMTVETLRDLGHSVEIADGGAMRVRRGPRVSPRYEVPGDYSSAVPLLAAAAAASGEIRLEGLRWPSGDADAGAVPVLEAMGLAVAGSPEALVASRRGPLRPVETRAADFPDAVPALAALAALADGVSRFRGIGHLRLKESDRIAALEELITAAGGRARSDEDTLEVTGPARPRPATSRLSTHRDHRMAMAGAILAMGLPGLLIEDPGCVAKSYPGFFRDLQRLRR